jgi:hypothetical protein
LRLHAKHRCFTSRKFDIGRVFARTRRGGPEKFMRAGALFLLQSKVVRSVRRCLQKMREWKHGHLLDIVHVERRYPDKMTARQVALNSNLFSH